ncbi:MAG: hypothetical protein ACLTSX_02775 [Collinsella sp.]
MLMSAFSITYAIATPVLALSTGRIPRRTLLIGASYFAPANSAAVLATSFEMLLCGPRAHWAWFRAPYIGATYIPELAGMKRISICISLVYAAFSIATAPPRRAVIAATWEWHYAVIGTLVMSPRRVRRSSSCCPAPRATDIPPLHASRCRPARSTHHRRTAIFMFGVGSILRAFCMAT